MSFGYFRKSDVNEQHSGLMFLNPSTQTLLSVSNGVLVVGAKGEWVTCAPRLARLDFLRDLLLKMENQPHPDIVVNQRRLKQVDHEKTWGVPIESVGCSDEIYADPIQAQVEYFACPQCSSQPEALQPGVLPSPDNANKSPLGEKVFVG